MSSTTVQKYSSKDKSLSPAERRRVGRNNGNMWGKATYKKESDNICQLGCQICY
jgi:hypothetical protein